MITSDSVEVVRDTFVRHFIQALSEIEAAASSQPCREDFIWESAEACPKDTSPATSQCGSIGQTHTETPNTPTIYHKTGNFCRHHFCVFIC